MPSFFTLNTAFEITKVVKAREAEFRQRYLAAGKAIVFGKPFTNSKMKSLYKGADNLIPLDPLSAPPNAPDWLHFPRPKDRVDIRQRDVIHWEAQARTALCIISMMELINQALCNCSCNICDASFVDLYATSVKCTKDLLKVITAWFSNLVNCSETLS